jgi:hypothetical protein
MVERSQHLHLTRETRQSVGVAGERLRQNLYGHIAVQLGNR